MAHMKFRALKILFSVALFIGSIATAFAREVTFEEAVRAAQRWSLANSPLIGATSKVIAAEAVSDETGCTLYYKVLFAEEKLFIVMGDTQLTPILAVVDTKQLRIPRTHPLLDLLNGDAKIRHKVFVSEATSSDNAERKARIAANQHAWAQLLSDVPLPHSAKQTSIIKGWEPDGGLTHWYQESRNRYGTWQRGEVYDRYTPNHTYTGCVATAGATILEHLRIPQGPEQVTRMCRLEGKELPLTTLGGAYDWTLLPHWQPGVELSEEAKELLGRVSYDVGVCVATWYDPQMSGSAPSTLASALPKYFGVQTTYLKGSGEKEQRLSAAQHIYPQVNAGTPVVLGLMGAQSGHAAIAVGYGEDTMDIPYTRLFMGWGGWYDTWYALPEVSTCGALFPLLRDAVLIHP